MKDEEYTFHLEDRIAKIKAINEQYDLENNAYISFSGGKDSTILHYLIDLALPNNKIPRVFLNTGIEFKLIREYVKSLAKDDDRFVIYNSNVNIKKMLNENGYPFKSKGHSACVCDYNLHKDLLDSVLDKGCDSVDFLHALPKGTKNVYKYVNNIRERERTLYINSKKCPSKLRYQFSSENKLKISDKCCFKLKKEIAHKYELESKKKIVLTGMRSAEGGNRSFMNCTIFKKDKLNKFHPLLVVTDEFEDEFIKKNNIRLCDLYYEPYNFKRTGCKGCPFNLRIQEDLNTLYNKLPNEYKQCILIWKPVYDEYIRLQYRLKYYPHERGKQLSIFDMEEEE